jgi:transcriptional regulator with XRE-family HTH domain
MPRQTTSISAKEKEAERLIKVRKALGLTQIELAQEFKVTRQALSMWERGERTIPGPVLKLIEIYEAKAAGKKKK